MVQWDVCQNLATELHIIYNYNNYIYTLYNGQKKTHSHKQTNVVVVKLQLSFVLLPSR